jgi:DNA polymerase III subunit chi
MTEVAFHFGVPDRLAYACRLLRKAYRSGVQVCVTGPAQLLDTLDSQLWTFEPLEFVPHWRGARESALPPRLVHTPLVLADAADAPQARPVLVTLLADVPASFERHERVIEIVSRDEADRAQARMRWRAYEKAGAAITRHEVAA